MTQLQVQNNLIPAMSDAAIEKVVVFERELGKLPQIDLHTLHTLHGGVYTRTIKLPEGAIVGGALIKVPTTIIIQGNVIVYMENEAKELNGYNVFIADAHRKQAVVAKSEVYWTMIFKSCAKTIEEAEKEFTDEYEKLLSRKNLDVNTIIIGII